MPKGDADLTAIAELWSPVVLDWQSHTEPRRRGVDLL